MTEATSDIHFFGAARELFRCHAPEVLICGAAGTGKSWACAMRIITLCEEHPGIRVLAARKTRASMTESTCVTIEAALGDGHPALVEGGNRRFRHAYQFPNGSEIVLAGLDNPTRLYSSQYDVIYISEAVELTLDEWERLHRALRNNKIPHPDGPAPDGTPRYFHQLLADTNPDRPTHWLILRCNEGKCVKLDSHHRDNPVITLDYIRSLSLLTGVRRKRLYENIWAAADGMVYDGWERDIHVVNETPKVYDAKFCIGSVDWGWNDPGVLQVWLVDGDKRAMLAYEVYRRNKLIEWWVDQAKQLTKLFKVERWMCDPSQPGYIEAFRRGGLMAREANNDVLKGIDAVSNRLRVQLDGKPRLTIWRNALAERDSELSKAGQPCGLIEEMESYVWEETRDGTRLKDKPRDYANHSQDSCRYATMEIDRHTIGSVVSVTTRHAE